MKNEDTAEIEYHLETSADGKKAIITLTSTEQMSLSDFYMALEFYICEMIRAEDQRGQEGALVH